MKKVVACDIFQNPDENEWLLEHPANHLKHPNGSAQQDAGYQEKKQGIGQPSTPAQVAAEVSWVTFANFRAKQDNQIMTMSEKGKNTADIQ